MSGRLQDSRIKPAPSIGEVADYVLAPQMARDPMLIRLVPCGLAKSGHFQQTFGRVRSVADP